MLSTGEIFDQDPQIESRILEKTKFLSQRLQRMIINDLIYEGIKTNFEEDTNFLKVSLPIKEILITGKEFTTPDVSMREVITLFMTSVYEIVKKFKQFLLIFDRKLPRQHLFLRISLLLIRFITKGRLVSTFWSTTDMEFLLINFRKFLKHFHRKQMKNLSQNISLLGFSF